LFPKVGAAEIHLATGFQNIIYDSSSLPNAFQEEAYKSVKKELAGERKQGETEEQFIHSTRKKALGPLKKRWRDLPGDEKSRIMKELEERFALLFHKLKVVGTKKYVQENMKPLLIRHEIGLP